MNTQSQRMVWIVNSVAPVGKHISDLFPFEFGIVNTETGLVIDPKDIGNCGWQFAIGSPNGKQRTDGSKVNRFHNAANHDMPFHSEKYTHRSDVKNIRTIPFKTEKSVNEYYLGFNGLDKCKSLKFDCGKTYQYMIYVDGEEVRATMGREFTEVIEVTTPCCSPCGNGDCNQSLDPNEYTDMLVKAANESFWVGRFFTAHKVVSCSPALPVPNKTFCNDFCLTLCDNGTELDLSKVQNQYPDMKVTVKERKGPLTTYTTTKIADATVPADYTATSVVVEDCATCPEGTTAQPGGMAYIVEIDNTQDDTTPAAQLAAAQAVFPKATFAQKTNFTKGTSTYYIVSSAVLPPTTGDAKIVLSLGEVKNKCVGGPVTAPWSACGQKYRITRDLCITIKNDACVSDAAELEELTALMAGVADVVPGTVALSPESTACITRYNVSQYSNCLEDGCDTYGTDGAKFGDLPSFKNQMWDVCPCVGWTVNANGCPVPPVPVDRCCQTGVKFVAKRFADDIEECLIDLDNYKTPNDITLNASLITPDADTCNNEIPDFVQLGFATVDSSRGIDVLKQVIAYRMAFESEKFMPLLDKMGFKFRASEGLRYGVDLEARYNLVLISANRQMNLNYNAANYNNRTDFALYVHEGNPELYENLQGYLAGSFDEACFEKLC